MDTATPVAAPAATPAGTPAPELSADGTPMTKGLTTPQIIAFSVIGAFFLAMIVLIFARRWYESHNEQRDLAAGRIRPDTIYGPPEEDNIYKLRDMRGSATTLAQRQSFPAPFWMDADVDPTVAHGAAARVYAATPTGTAGSRGGYMCNVGVKRATSTVDDNASIVSDPFVYSPHHYDAIGIIQSPAPALGGHSTDRRAAAGPITPGVGGNRDRQPLFRNALRLSVIRTPDSEVNLQHDHWV